MDAPSPEGFFDAVREEADLWFAPSPETEDLDGSLYAPLPRANDKEQGLTDDWRVAEREHLNQIARVAQRLGALDDRLGRGPPGWGERLAMMEASELSWFTGHRVPLDKLSLWLVLRIGSAQFEDMSMSKTAWAFSRLAVGPGPEVGLAEFLARREASGVPVTLDERIDAWRNVISEANDLHPFTRACFGYWLWPMAGIGPEGEKLEAAVVAGRQASAGCVGGCRFVPMALGGARGLRAGGQPSKRLKAWLDGLESGVAAAMRELDVLESWQLRATEATRDLSGRTPPELIRLLVQHVVLCAPVAEKLTGASRAAAQRNLVMFEERGLVREVTGQGRWRFWRAA
jgi:hypothetical protein